MSSKAKPGAAEQIYELGLARDRKRTYLRGLIDPEPLNMLSVIDNAVEYLRYTYNRRFQFENRYLF